MTSEEILEINCDRLAKWGASCHQNHATPLVLISIGHDHASGAVHVIHVTDLSKDQLIAVLAYAIKSMS